MKKEFIVPVPEGLDNWNLYYVVDIRTYTELVRCEDCEHWDRDTLNINNYGPNCLCIMVDHRTTPDFFCGDGKRKEQLP